MLQDGTILAWRYNAVANSFEPAAQLKGHNLAVITLVVGANKLYSGSMDKSIRVCWLTRCFVIFITCEWYLIKFKRTMVYIRSIFFFLFIYFFTLGNMLSGVEPWNFAVFTDSYRPHIGRDVCSLLGSVPFVMFSRQNNKGFLLLITPSVPK